MGDRSREGILHGADAGALADISALAGALDARATDLVRIADLLIERRAPHSRSSALTLDQALAVATCSSIAARLAPGDAVEAVRLNWPEIVSVALVVIGGSAGEPAASTLLAISGGLSPPPFAELVRPEEPPPPFAAVFDLAPAVLAVRPLFGDAEWRRGVERLDTLFDRESGRVVHRGSFHAVPRGSDFLDEGPYEHRLRRFVEADVATLFKATGPIEARRLRRHLEYLLEPAPLDLHKREAGSDELLPRVKHLVEAIASAGGVEHSAKRHPEVLKNVEAADAARTLIYYLELMASGRSADGD